jgi:hypothetical protein
MSLRPDMYSGTVVFGVAPKQSVVAASTYDIEISQEHTDLNIAEPLTKTSLTSKT